MIKTDQNHHGWLLFGGKYPWFWENQTRRICLYSSYGYANWFSADDEKDKDIKEAESEEEEEEKDKAPRPKALHKTQSIFLRNLDSFITKQEVEAVSKQNFTQ